MVTGRFGAHRIPLTGHLTIAPASRARIPAGQEIHCQRHFYASKLIRSGWSVKPCLSRFGHATAAESLDTYALPVRRVGYVGTTFRNGHDLDTD